MKLLIKLASHSFITTQPHFKQKDFFLPEPDYNLILQMLLIFMENTMLN